MRSFSTIFNYSLPSYFNSLGSRTSTSNGSHIFAAIYIPPPSAPETVLLCNFASFREIKQEIFDKITDYLIRRARDTRARLEIINRLLNKLPSKMQTTRIKKIKIIANRCYV